MSILLEKPNTNIKSTSLSDEDLYKNHLHYGMPYDMSLAVNRTQKNQWAECQEYKPSSTMVCVLKTGVDFVDWSSSFLEFDCKNTSDLENDFALDYAGAFSLIQNIRVFSNTNIEIYRVENINLLIQKMLLYSYPPSFLENYGQQFGNADIILNGETSRFSLPLKILGGVFAPYNSINSKAPLCPPQLANGMRIEIDFSPAVVAFKSTIALSTPDYSVTNIFIRTENVTMSDDGLRVINEIARTRGINYLFNSYYSTTKNIFSKSEVFQVSKAFTSVNRAICIHIITEDYENLEEDSFNSAPWNTSTYRFRVGNHYYPFDGVGNSSLDPALSSVEGLQNANYTFNKNKWYFRENNISLSDFKETEAVQCASFERNPEIKNTGIPINSSRILEYEIQRESDLTNEKIYMFVEYTAFLRVYTDNVVLRI